MAPTNRLITLLSEADQDDIRRKSVVTSLRLGKRLYDAGGRIDAVYFPIDSVISILIGPAPDDAVEMATIGNEGVAGAYSILGDNRAIGHTIVQVAGEAVRMEVSAFRAQIDSSQQFRSLIQRYLFALTRQVLEAGACNRLHTMEQRCARWLLMMHDRTASDTFSITQDFLAKMLGVRRATVNIALGVLKGAGLIQYTRGKITVLGRQGLERASCPCYELIRQELLRVEDCRTFSAAS